MEKKVAVELIGALKNLDSEFKKISEITQKIQEENEKVKFRQNLGLIVGDIYTEMMIPILREHPELDPDK